MLDNTYSVGMLRSGKGWLPTSYKGNGCWGEVRVSRQIGMSRLVYRWYRAWFSLLLVSGIVVLSADYMLILRLFLVNQYYLVSFSASFRRLLIL